MELSAADSLRIGVVNLTTLFDESAFVKDANKKLQGKVKEFESQLQVEQSKLQDLANKYEHAKDNKNALKKKIIDQQTLIATKTQESQAKVRDAQNAGMQKFSELVRVAAEKIAKEKKLNAVLSSSSLVYSDDSLVDITKDVAAQIK
jgi:Skp family chaperone for outer membrane proteins